MTALDPRLHVILARLSDVAVIFRRGPTRQVMLIRWQRDDDSFACGQWFKGHIYQHRCDLSPSGERLLYFAATHRPPYRTWTAVSRPPFLTALVLWPKGDAWGGGGLFATESRILLNHPPSSMSAVGHGLPRHAKVLPFGPRSGAGEDAPVHEARLARDGWAVEEEGAAELRRSRIRMVAPRIWSRRHPGKRLTLRFSLSGLYAPNRRKLETEAAVFHGDDVVLALGACDWADWDRNGDLLVARDGQIVRHAWRDGSLEAGRLLLDTRSLSFRELPPTHAAQTWKDALDLEELRCGGDVDRR